VRSRRVKHYIVQTKLYDLRNAQATTAGQSKDDEITPSVHRSAGLQIGEDGREFAGGRMEVASRFQLGMACMLFSRGAAGVTTSVTSRASKSKKGGH
jgi:hypothetical protein